DVYKRQKPEEGKNANLAAAAATQNLYGISRHSDGATRVNVGLMGGGTATNIVAEEAFIEGEVRGATTELMEYMEDRAHTVIESAAAMHDCEVEIGVEGKAPSARSDDALAAIVGGVSEGVEGVTSILESDDLGGSEDATYLMQHVQDCGGLAAYVGVGTDHPGGHHTRTFDVDEETIRIAVDVLAASVDRIATERP
ncbi:indole-3-acetyl-L-aspartic acid hydrolase, partial [Haloferax volcanii DSM 14919]